MSRYLEEAAQLIRKAADANEQTPDKWPEGEGKQRRRVEYARAFSLLAAIDKGLLPQEMAEAIYGQFEGVA
jgi:hypothetical protein